MQPDPKIAARAHQCVNRKWLPLGTGFSVTLSPRPLRWAGEVGPLDVALLALWGCLCIAGHVHSGSAPQNPAGASRELSPWGLKLDSPGLWLAQAESPLG